MDALQKTPLYSVYGAAFGLLYLYQTLTNCTFRVPGPWHTKWTSVVVQYKWLKGDRTAWVHGLHKKYGPVVRVAPDEVSIVDTETAKALYARKETFRKSIFYKYFGSTAIPSLFSTRDPEYHKRHRKLLAGPMSESQLKKVIPRVHDRVTFALDRIEREMDTRGAADMLKWWFFMATDIIGELSFGVSFKMLETGEKNDYINDLVTLNGMNAVRSTFPTLVTWSSYLPFGGLHEAYTAVLNMRKYAAQSIARYRTFMETDPVGAEISLFNKLIKAEEKDSFTEPELVGAAQAYIITGSDTVANTLTYITWCLSNRPAIRARLVEELMTLPHDYTEADLRQLKYLGWVLEESLRLYNAAPSMLPREVPAEGATLAGHHFKGGTVVGVQSYSLHRDPRIFADAETFAPERWEAPTQAMRDAMMPFSRGARTCIGMYLAMIELRLAVTGFFRRFPHATASRVEGMSDADMDMQIFLAMSPRGNRCLVQKEGGDGEVRV